MHKGQDPVNMVEVYVGSALLKLTFREKFNQWKNEVYVFFNKISL